MFCYHDYNYVKFILDSDFKTGYSLYNRCIDRLNEVPLWDLYLLDIQRGYDKCFDIYKDEKLNSDSNLSKEAKKSENERILKKYGGLKA
jgi:hypothetical protein